MIKRTHPQVRRPTVFDVTELQQSQKLPSLKDIQNSFDKLRDLCMPCKSTYTYNMLPKVD